jgi:hypothetical protein
MLGEDFSDPGVTAQDNVDGDLSDQVAISGEVNTEQVGIYTLEYSVRDDAGNSARKVNRTVSVQQASAPVVTAPASITVAATNAGGTLASDSQIEVFLQSASAKDETYGVIVDIEQDAPFIFPIGATTVTFTATNSDGETGSAQATVTVVDMDAPEITLIGDSSVTITLNTAFIDEGATATDNVDGTLDAFILTEGAVDSSTAGIYTLSYTASDSAGNTAQVSRKVSVQETGVPVVTAPEAITVAAVNSAGASRFNDAVWEFLSDATAMDSVDGELTTISHNAPDTFPMGTTSVTFSVMNSAGQTGYAQSTVTVIDQDAPSITVPTDITLSLESGSAITTDNSQVQVFLSGVTASDNVDGDLVTITHNTPYTIPTGVTVVTFTAVDSSGNQSSAKARITVSSADTDADGIPDDIEQAYGLDPEDPTDANQDTDGDGLSNLVEYQQGGNLIVDDVPPELIAPADLIVESSGIKTAVLLEMASAQDVKDGSLTVTVSDIGPFTTGRHFIEWSASDAAGNMAVAQQVLDIIPQVSLSPSQSTGEGNTVNVGVYLNGPAVEYPVTIEYGLSGSALEGQDFEPQVGYVTIDSGTQASIPVAIYDDRLFEGEEVIELTLTSADGAILSHSDQHLITIKEVNIAPTLSLSIAQAEEDVTTVIAGDGLVQMSLEVIDPNVTDSHSIDWSLSHNMLTPEEGYSGHQFTFDPSELAEGAYSIKVVVSDDGQPALSTQYSTLIRIKHLAPDLKADEDSDGDGISDAQEGFVDRDMDRIPDHLDKSNTKHILPANNMDDAMQTEAGLSLRIGDTAFASGNRQARVDESDIANHGGDSGNQADHVEDALYSYSTGLYDFEVIGVEAADSATVVIPLEGVIPVNGVYRKYRSNQGWQDFVENDKNSIASASGSSGTCPSPNDEAYKDGLIPGYTCIQLTIEDGGPNDTDGEANGTVSDPGGVAVQTDNLPELVTPDISNLEFNDTIQKIYIAYYGRSADPGGLAYWNGKLAAVNGNLYEIIGDFGNSDEFYSRFGGLSNSDLLDNIYQQMFGRAPDEGGKAFYLGKLDAGEMDLQTITLNVLNGAQNEDAEIVANKVLASNLFTYNLERFSFVYAGNDAAGLAKDLLDSVDADSDVTDLVANFFYSNGVQQE